MADHLRIAGSDHQGKARRLGPALASQGHEMVSAGLADVVLIDTDWPPPTGSIRWQWIEEGVSHDGIVVVYPHSAGPAYDYDGKIQPDMRVTAHLAQGPGEIEVYRRFGFPLPVYDVGWFYCDVVPFAPVKHPRRLLFAPTHTTGFGEGTEAVRNTNRLVFEQALDCGGELTVQMYGSAEQNGIWEDPRARFVPSDLILSHEHIDEADAVIGDGTLAHVAVARGKPVVMIGQYGLIGPRPQKTGPASSWLERLWGAEFAHWEDYAGFLRYPYDVSDGSLAEMLERACQGGPELQRWTEMFVGQPLEPAELSTLLMQLYANRHDRQRLASVRGPRGSWLPGAPSTLADIPTPGATSGAAALPRGEGKVPRHILMGPVYGVGGYGSGLRGLAAACDAAGLPTRLEETVWSTWDAGLEGGHRQALDEAFQAPVQPGEPHLRLWSFLPHYFRPDGSARRTIGRAACDTDRLSQAFLQGCGRVNQVWVPNHFSFETFASSGVPPAKLRLLPTCVDTARIRSAAHVDPGSERSFNFLCIGEWVLRKGWDVLIGAFLREFKADEDVALIIKMHALTTSAEAVAAQIGQMAQRENGGGPTPPVRLLFGALPEATIHGLMRSCQAYVQPSRGEGWGHSLMEAMGAGLPTIATRWGAHLDFMDDTNSYLLDCQLTDVPSEGWSYHPSYRGHRWAEPSVDHLQAVMRAVFRDRAAAADRAARAAQRIETNFNAAAAGALLRSLSAEL